MGTVIRRMLVCGALAASMIPGAAHASTTTVAPPYLSGPRGGDQYNNVIADPNTGEMTVLRVNPTGPSGGLGCGGSGGYANFEVDLASAPAGLQSVTVSYSQAVVDPYTWINVGVRQDDHYLGSRVERGVLAGSGTVTVPVSGGHAGAMQVWFGIQTASACPNVDGGHAIFDSVSFGFADA